ncbi:hypothetical protein [Singulisphaera acidiphila]|uniref:Uncharacterized protein n=1 Tax=Singulisphaera acidiphila (strain ATCC BAA-1392 / DSM 18658 / VKM B-2454 / MOB10) TaxID=886293 RepID=L0DHC6_SINAD|nr:hypothetical protein [Singulisphaera acidiphila]AGA28662.1 hypothetical protein Sinac_4473 [Singulisphaera acidiphila DSM 18658]
MAVVVALGIILAWVRAQGSLSYALIVVSYSFVAWGFSFAIAFTIARVFVPAVRGHRRRAGVSSLLVIGLVASLYLAWGHNLAMHQYLFGLNRRFPYPDLAINTLERWFNARRPVPPGTMKLHGEYPVVGIVLGMLVIVFTSFSGFLLGVLLTRQGGQEPVVSEDD